MKKSTIIILTILVLVLYLLIFWEVFLTRDLGRDNTDQCLKVGSIWEYENKKEDLVITMKVIPRDDYNYDCIAEYCYKGRKGEWTLYFDSHRFGKVKVTGGCLWLEKEAFLEIWEAKADVMMRKIIITNIENTAQYTGLEERGEWPKELEDANMPNDIKEIELIRVQ